MQHFILLLSNDIFTCISLEDEFAALGFDTVSVIHHEEARSVLVERRSEILGIFCDVDFVYMSERDLFPAVPVVMLSSSEPVEPGQHVHLLRKPITPLEIVAKMSHSLLGTEGKDLWDEGNKAFGT